MSDTPIRIMSYDKNDRYSRACLNSIYRFFPNHPEIILHEGEVTYDDLFIHVFDLKPTSLVLNPFDRDNFNYNKLVPLSQLEGKKPEDVDILTYDDVKLDSVHFLLNPIYKNISLELYDLFRELADG